MSSQGGSCLELLGQRRWVDGSHVTKVNLFYNGSSPVSPLTVLCITGNLMNSRFLDQMMRKSIVAADRVLMIFDDALEMLA